MRRFAKISDVILIMAMVSMPVFSQDIQRSSNPQGVQIRGNVDLRVQQEEAVAVSVGESNVARNSTSSIRGGTQIQGNTKISAEQKNATATAVGKRSAAENEVGVIGGK